MAKGQVRSTREARKPKKDAAVREAEKAAKGGSVTATFAKPQSGGGKSGKR